MSLRYLAGQSGPPALVGCSGVSGGNDIFTLDKPGSVVARRHMRKRYISRQ